MVEYSLKAPWGEISLVRNPLSARITSPGFFFFFEVFHYATGTHHEMKPVKAFLYTVGRTGRPPRIRLTLAGNFKFSAVSDHPAVFSKTSGRMILGFFSLLGTWDMNSMKRAHEEHR